MILRDVPEWTWVSFRGNPCFLKYKNAREAYLIDCNKKNYIASIEDYVEPLNVPKFNKDDSVLCINKKAPCYNQILTITSVRTFGMCSKYAPYKIGDNFWAMSFDIQKLDY
jgi:hypothetical protein